jgi:hypothetical protein
MECSRIVTTKGQLGHPSECFVIERNAGIFMNATTSESSWRLKCELNLNSCRPSVTYNIHQAKHEYIDLFKKCSYDKNLQIPCNTGTQNLLRPIFASTYMNETGYEEK